MDSATLTVPAERGTLRKSIGFVKTTSVKTLLLLGIILTFSSAFAQQKTINKAELQQKLTEVNAKLQEVEEKLEHVHYRIQGVPIENVAPEIQQRLSDLEIKKNQFSREKVSIEAALNAAQSQSNPNDSPEPTQDNSLMFSDQHEHNQNQ